MTPELSRRNLLLAIPSSLLLAPSAPCSTSALAEGWQRFLTIERSRVVFELSLYKRIIAPQLVQSRYRDEAGQWQVAPDYPRLRSHQVVADTLIDALDTLELPTDLAAQPAMDEMKNASLGLDPLSPSNSTTKKLIRGCWIACCPRRRKLIWNCTHLYATSSPAELSQAAVQILSYMGPRVPTDCMPIYTLRQLAPGRIGAFSRMDPFWYVWLMGPLFAMFPSTPDIIFSIGLRQRRSWLNAAGLSNATDEQARGPGIDHLCRSVVSAAFCAAISTLANNNFREIPRLARRTDLAGDWLSLIPGQILGVVYQKVLILNLLAREGWLGLPEGLRQKFALPIRD